MFEFIRKLFGGAPALHANPAVARVAAELKNPQVWTISTMKKSFAHKCNRYRFKHCEKDFAFTLIEPWGGRGAWVSAEAFSREEGRYLGELATPMLTAYKKRREQGELPEEEQKRRRASAAVVRKLN